jgi:hypothetical protein
LRPDYAELAVLIALGQSQLRQADGQRQREVQVEDESPYDEDPWEDDWDWEWPEEPPITYREAVERLGSLTQGRADVRIEWGGLRTLPRDDARVVFSGAAGTSELRVRFRSATQLDDFVRIIDRATLLADRHAIWYPNERVITARLVGDYDQFHAAVARGLAPRQSNRPFVPDSPAGRDVAGILASTGAFFAREAMAPTGLDPRTIRLVAANQDLRVLYGPRGQESPSVAIELAGFAAANAAGAEEVLLEYGTAYLFKLGKATGVSLRLWRSEYRLGSRRRQAYSGRVRFPQQRYDPHPAELYAAGNSAARDRVERYLKYYQVLEFYMPKAADLIAASQGLPVNKAISPLPRPSDNGLGAEKNKLDAVISLAVTQAQMMNLLGDNELFAALTNKQVIQDVQVLTPNASGQPIAGHDYRAEISRRVYEVRNRIVHMKEGGGQNNKRLLAPYSREARDLTADLRLVRFLAEHTMEYWAASLP